MFDNKTVNLAMAIEMLKNYVHVQQPTMLWGPPGVGKSQIVAQLADDMDYKLNDFRAPLRDAVDMRGLPQIDVKAGKTRWLSPDELPDEKRDGKHGFLFLDELNAASKEVMVACYGLVLDRKLGEYRLPDGWAVIAAGNRQEDRAAANRMPSALANRFAHIHVEADPNQWIRDFAIPHNCDPMVIGFIRAHGDYLHKMDADAEDNERFPTPRSWEAVSKICNVPDQIRFQQVAGLVGGATAHEFEAFVQTYQQLPDIDDIVADPKRTPVPDEPSALYAVSTALGRFATRDNFKPILTYAERLGAEYQVIVAMDATHRDEGLTKTKAYIKFVEDNKNLQIGAWAA